MGDKCEATYEIYGPEKIVKGTLKATYVTIQCDLMLHPDDIPHHDYDPTPGGLPRVPLGTITRVNCSKPYWRTSEGTFWVTEGKIVKKTEFQQLETERRLQKIESFLRGFPQWRD